MMFMEVENVKDKKESKEKKRNEMKNQWCISL